MSIVTGDTNQDHFFEMNDQITFTFLPQLVKGAIFQYIKDKEYPIITKHDNMKNQITKFAQKLADKVTSKKYEKMVDGELPKVKKANASIYKQLLYKKLE